MNGFRLLLRSLRFYWRTHLAVLLGVAVGTAVIAGALVVGDSIRYSLKKMSLDRLGQVDYALTGSRFFRQQVAVELANTSSPMSPDAETSTMWQVAPAILVTGTIRFTADDKSAEKRADSGVRIAGRVNLIGIEQQGWEFLNPQQLTAPAENEIVLNARVAEQLGVIAGDEVTLFVDIPETIPQESLLGERDIAEKVVEFPLTVSAIAPDVTGPARFSLQPNQQLPLNAYVHLEQLQAELDLLQQAATPRNPIAKPSRINTLLVHDPAYREGVIQEKFQGNSFTPLNAPLQTLWQLEDFYLALRSHPQQKYFSLESERMILEGSLSYLAEQTAESMGAKSSAVLVYLMNEILPTATADSEDSADGRYSMYSVAAGVELTQQTPFGPLLDGNGNPLLQLQDDEVAVNSWLADDLQLTAGDRITVRYHVVGDRGELPEESREFRVAAVLPLGDSLANDSGFTPFVEGITDAKSFSDWEQPFPMKMEQITERDDEYWEQYKSTPKLFLSLSAAQELWQSRYGNLTSVRISPPAGKTGEQAEQEFRKQFLRNLPASQLGLMLQPVKEQGLQAARGTQDFSGLFFGFSFFVIAAATVLMMLLFQLGMERRVTQIGLLSAIGFSRYSILRLLLAEGTWIAVAGAVLGMLGAVGYARLMIYGLTTWWRGAIGTSFLVTDIRLSSLLIGGLISMMASVPGMYAGIRKLMKQSCKDQLMGLLADNSSVTAGQHHRGWKFVAGLVCVGVSVVSVVGVLLGQIPKTEAFGGFHWQIVVFFASGFLGLIGSLLLFVVWLRFPGQRSLNSAGIQAAVQLGWRNTSRNRQRSCVTVILVSLATFVVIAVAAGKQNPTQMEPVFYSGNGGFTLVAESARPLLYDLTTATGQSQLGLISSQEESLRQELLAATIYPFRVRSGEDASCLNLYQTRLPTVLGVPQAMIERGGFLFADTPGENPWKLLNGRTAAGRIPVIADQNTLQYSLHKAIGHLIELPEEVNTQTDLQVVGALGGSVFQGVLLVSEENFLQLFPEISGYRYFLIESPVSSVEAFSQQLETGLVAFGLDVELVGRRLENFLAVQNTYLSTFQALGGFGLLLGTFGMATVMLRNVLERRAELALMRAIGFRKSLLAILVYAENAWLLIVGLGIGTGTALLAMLPTMSSQAGEIPWQSGLFLLAGVFAAGMGAAGLAVLEAIRTPILESLRSE